MNTARQLYDAAKHVHETNPTIAWRYDVQTVKLTLAQSIQRWLRGITQLQWNWSRTKIVMRPIRPGEPGYDKAAYEMSVIYLRDVYRVWVAK